MTPTCRISVEVECLLDVVKKEEEEACYCFVTSTENERIYKAKQHGVSGVNGINGSIMPRTNMVNFESALIGRESRAISDPPLLGAPANQIDT